MKNNEDKRHEKDVNGKINRAQERISHRRTQLSTENGQTSVGRKEFVKNSKGYPDSTAVLESIYGEMPASTGITPLIHLLPK